MITGGLDSMLISAGNAADTVATTSDGRARNGADTVAEPQKEATN